nr:MAG TPA: hypothetical protein [Caudoviricetes sp.]
MAVAAFGRWAAHRPPAARFAFALCLSANRAAGNKVFRFLRLKTAIFIRKSESFIFIVLVK